MSFHVVGKKVRLSRILPDGKALVFAFDHGLEHGPQDFPPWHIDPKTILSKVVEAGVDAIMLLPGMAKQTYEVWAGKTALIVKVTGKSVLRPKEQQLVQSPVGVVEEAVALGADGVAATVYWGSPQEDAMLQIWTEVAFTAETYGLPVLQLAYPRGPTIPNRYDVEIVRYAARAAVEVGADLIKTYYTGSKETFAEVVKAAGGVPVLMSGGAKAPKPIDFLRVVKNVMEAGARGVVVGRNIFQSKDPKGMAKAILAIVHEGLEPEEALKYVHE